MSDWWAEPYKGGPMVALPGFPRPLYPPDANKQGKKPSVDGPDVIAYKRTISRAGRWPWKTYDDTFNNNFSHGQPGGGVADSGVAGFQRQMKIQDTGWVGKQVFNALRSVRIPEGLPHAGDMAMDAKAQSLLVQAWDEFGGSEPDPPPTKTLRQAAYELAVTQLGIKESPPGTNSTKYCDWYGMVGPWCAMFVTWAYENAGNSPSFAKGARYAYVPYVVNDARSKINGLSVTSSPVAGDLVCFDWAYDGCYDHIGLFEGWGGTSPSQFTCIEGNTAVGDDSDGGEVMRRTRNTQQQATVFVRVKE